MLCAFGGDEKTNSSASNYKIDKCYRQISTSNNSGSKTSMYSSYDNEIFPPPPPPALFNDNIMVSERRCRRKSSTTTRSITPDNSPGHNVFEDYDVPVPSSKLVTTPSTTTTAAFDSSKILEAVSVLTYEMKRTNQEIKNVTNEIHQVANQICNMSSQIAEILKVAVSVHQRCRCSHRCFQEPVYMPMSAPNPITGAKSVSRSPPTIPPKRIINRRPSVTDIYQTKQ